MTQIPTWSSGNTAPISGRAAPGTLIGGRYTLRAAVGHGGMGTVWRAADTLLRRDVAIKEVILPPGLAPSDRDAMYERTMREARAAAALQHPAVVQVYDVVHENGRPWIVMELLEARSLADMVIEDGPVSARVVAKIGIALLGALEVAHAHGVLHRDVKPANVLICTDGRCVLTDFGVARMPTDVQLTTPGMVLGSPHFISPERAMGSDFGPPSDLFSLGVTLYTAIEGRPPFDKGDPIETMHAVVEDPPTPAVRAGSLTPVLMGLLEKDPARRFDVQTARTMLRQQLAGPLASKAPPHLMTDPYSVVPSQRPPAAETQPIPPQPKPSGQIGGRAMLAPGESLSGHLAKLKRNGAEAGPHRADGGPDAADQPTGAYPGPRRSDDTSVIPPTAGGDTTSVLPPRQQWDGARAAREPMAGGTVVMSPGAKRKALIDKTVAAARETTGKAVTTVRGWPRNTQLAAGGGLAAVLVLVLVLTLSSSGGGDDAKTPTAGGGPQPSAAAVAPFPTVSYKGRGTSVSVPKGWEKRSATSYVDYVDKGADRRVRLLVESGNGTAQGFLKIAENNLKRKGSSCPKPYTQVSLTDQTIAGQPGAVLEYTCSDERHGLWGAVMRDGKAYSFYLTSTEEQFAESRPIFDELVRTFALG
ncbi:serine/threonine-protein kinase [Couchioplanes caeruleus]|uniref:non-specific serine/threonine protein kinase n=2 Tax=Couchioplanes caeruleus TaxID=56438 RepID=A0A1K0F9R7_9ACTN|nr:serine/threonine-protein kinase [Couchioplanes caeruleus]OJF09480.1 serine/threonine protein kinase [Couchioplanes caeruleus subsp. caeruleus]ROP31917.1 serine/threonine protein kinase [Couchioplanes caeruleus]